MTTVTAHINSVLAGLESGDAVRVVYKLATDRLPREMYARYLWRETKDGADRLYMHGRPTFGTTFVDVDDLILVERTTAAPRRPRIYRAGQSR
jgi:hypothetical protein